MTQIVYHLNNRNYYEVDVMADDIVLGTYEFRRANEIKMEIYEHLIEPIYINKVAENEYAIHASEVYYMPTD